MPIETNCCCGCAILIDEFNRSGEELAADGVNIFGGSRYSFSSGTWAVVSNALKCQTTGAALTFHTGNAYVLLSSVKFAAVGDYLELSNGHETVKLTVENYTYLTSTKKRLKVEFHGYTNYKYGSSIAFGLTLPYTLFNLDLRMMDCSKSWNKACAYVEHTDTDLVFCSAATRVGQGTFFDGFLSYTWTLKATSGVIVDGLRISRNDIDCGTTLPQCSQTCGGLWPDSITLNIGEFSDASVNCATSGYSSCLSSCFSAYMDAIHAYQPIVEAYRATHGDFDPPDYCAQLQAIKDAYKTCRCGCVESHFDCQVSSPCASLSGSLILDRRDTPENQLGSGCGVYDCYIPLPGFYLNGAACGDTGSYETGWYLFIECFVSVVYHDELVPKRTKYRYDLWTPFLTGSSRLSLWATAEVGQAAWCDGSSLVSGQPYGTRLMSDLVLAAFKMSTSGAPLNYYGSIITSASFSEFPSCGPHPGGPLCGGSDGETCERQLGYDDNGDPVYDTPVEIGTTPEQVMADCPGSDADVPLYSLDSGGASG
jgi:hypothetical protein